MKVAPTWTLTTRLEKQLSYFLVMFLFVMAVLAAAIIALVMQNSELHKQNAYFESRRIMIGLPNEQGYFVTTDKIPTSQIKAYAHGFIVNCYNWRRDSVNENLEECQARMDEAMVMDEMLWIEGLKKRALDQGIVNVFIPERTKLESIKGGYKYTAQGVQQRIIGRNVYYDRQHEVVIEMMQTQPTYFRPLGLMVTSRVDKCLDCK